MDHAVIFLQGGEATTRYDTDHEHIFRQESFFHYLFGVKEPDFFGAIHCETEEVILFMARLPESYSIWMGEVCCLRFFADFFLDFSA